MVRDAMYQYTTISCLGLQKKLKHQLFENKLGGDSFIFHLNMSYSKWDVLKEYTKLQIIILSIKCV